MSPRTYNLFEMVDLALSTPEVGAVNFKVLNLLLKCMLKKSNIGLSTVQYEAADPTIIMKRILEGKEEITSSDESESEDVLEEINDIIEEIAPSEKAEASTNTDSQIWPVPELQELFTSVDFLKQKFEKLKKNVESLERQMKRTKKDMEKKLDSGEGQKIEQVSKSHLEREDFEETVEEMRNSIVKLAKKVKEQEQSTVGKANEEAINKLCEKAAEEEIEKRQGDFHDHLKTLTLNVRNLMKVVKDFLNPQAAGVTKCVTCGRSAHLYDLDLLNEVPSDNRTNSKIQEFARKKSSTTKANQKRNELKFTLLSLDNIKKETKQPASIVLQQNQELPLTLDARIESQGTKEKGNQPVNVFKTEEATSAFMPLRFIPDPTRSGTLLADAIYINPKIMSVSFLGKQKPEKLRFQAKPTQEECT